MYKVHRVLLSTVAILPLVAISAQAQENSRQNSSEALEEISVVGSFIKRKSQSDQAAPITTVDQGDLNNIGAFNAVDLVNTMTINAGAQNNADGFNQTNSIGTTNVNLRGLGVSSTLVLLNGRRQTQTAAVTLNGDQFVDLNSLVPSIAVERVEVLKDGASSLYGSDAVAGVVNFITRDKFEGMEIRSSYQSTTSGGQGDFQLSGLFGSQGDKLSIIAAFNYFDRSNLAASERADEFELRSASSVFGQPGTFLPLAGPNAFVRQPDPSCASQAAIDPAVTGVIPGGPIAGTCGFDFGGYFTLVAEETRFQGYTKINYDVTENVAFFTEFSFAQNKIKALSSPSQPILFPPVVPASNPGNFTGVPALWFGRVLGSEADSFENQYDSTTWRMAMGLTGDLSNSWSWEVGYTYSRNDYNLLRGDTDVDNLKAALAGNGGPSGNLYFNPLFGADNDPGVISDILSEYTADAEANLTTIDAHVTGDLFEMPAGSVAIAVGVQYRKDELSYDYDENTNSGNHYFNRQADDFAGDQSVYAGFIEMVIPVVENLELQGALRYEDFGDGVNTLDHKIGFLFQPSNSLSVRGTLGTSFRAPSIYQLNGINSVPARIFDPVGGGFATISQTTKADLNNPVTPQSSNTYNFGVTWAPEASGLRLSIDYWRFDYSDFITPENAAALIAVNPNAPGQVTRLNDDPNGQLLAVTTFYRNAGSLNTDGLDFSASYTMDTESAGMFRLSLDATRVLSYDLEDPVIGKVDALGLRNFTNFGNPVQEWRGNVGLNWVKDVHSFNAYVRYIGSYADDNSLDTNNDPVKIDNNVTVDLQYNLELGSLWDSEVGPVLTVGAKNIFDQMPSDVASRTGYDALTHNPLGRTVYVAVKATF